jgi:phosphatidate cytidylyltransferase
LNDFYKRTLTGAGIVIFILGGYWLHPVSFFLTGLILLTGCLYEYYMMIRRIGISPQVISGMITGVSLYVIATLVASETIPGKFFLLLIPFSAFIMIAELYRRQDKPADNIAHTFFPVIYAGVPFSMIPFSAFSHNGLNTILPVGKTVFSPGIIIGFFLLIWANDTGAYLSGRAFGKHKLMERISPKKTWEGFFGGMIIAAVIAWLLSDLLGVVDSMKWTIIAIIVSITGTFGDLVESMLKRSTGVKDSGKILPGHGGFLDRFDSTIISFPLVYLFLTLFG